MSRPTFEIIDIPESRGEEAIEVLALAFQRDPLIRFFLQRDDDAEFQRLIRQFFHFSCAVRWELGWPLLGLVDEHGIRGVACLSQPDDPPWPDSLARIYDALKVAQGEESTRRLETYADVTDVHRPQEPNVYLAVLGVHPEAQGRGVGRTLIEATQRLSEAHPTSTGVALDTENPDNVPIYEHCGYRLVAQDELEGLGIWTLYRPNGE